MTGSFAVCRTDLCVILSSVHMRKDLDGGTGLIHPPVPFEEVRFSDLPSHSPLLVAIMIIANDEMVHLDQQKQ